MITIKPFLSAGLVAGLALVFSAGGCKKSDSSGSADPDPAPQPAVTTPGAQTTPMTGSAGSQCSPNGAFGCSPVGIHEVHCVNGNWAQFRTCKGPLHCSHVGNNTKCDYGALMPGDVCAPPLNSMCTADHKGVLTCAGGRLAVTQTCTGGQQCKPGVGCKLRRRTISGRRELHRKRAVELCVVCGPRHRETGLTPSSPRAGAGPRRGARR